MKKHANEWEHRLAGKPPVKNGFTSDLERKVRERIRMNTTTRRAPLRAAAAIMSMVILLGAGWWFRDDLKELLRPAERSDVPAALSKDPLADKEYELKVQQFEMSNTFEYTFKKPFFIRHPSVKLNIDTSPDDLYGDPEKFEAWFDAEQPDVVQVPVNVYAKLAADGKLSSLDTLAKANKADLQALHAPLVDYLRQAGGNGDVYGLSADMTSTALYVNEDVFAAHGVPLPDGDLSMAQILQLAARFQGSGVSGLAAVDRSNKFALVALAGQAGGLQTIAETEGDMKATLNSDAWKKVWTTVVDGYRDGWINQAKPVVYGKNGTTMAEIGKQDPFALGQVAMVVRSSDYYMNLKSYEQAGVMKSNWSTVPIRLDASATNQDAFLGTRTIYAVNANSSQADAAWALVQFVTGGAWRAGLNPDSFMYIQLLANKSAMDGASGKQWEAFYETAADPAKAAASAVSNASPRFIKANRSLYALGGEEMNAILNKSVPIDTALGDLQAKLNAELAAIGKEARP
ncbi:ABC transporter substrate-binding protein [Paenibacillus glycinis]|uniref:Extracellular solute-binding protein n=1 Tax=Paenibacillus glycinis TaxID=2697035 RepID=A0ABW9XMC3_9BACL|nr:extracellular solute-binding protein [Paenibacillus glycinis]NBD23785.1 hypothetical protein [Paenibacillus glycinis]